MKNSNIYDIQASEPIKEILEKYFTDIKWSYDFQEATLENKKDMLRKIALEIDRNYHTTQYFEALKDVLDFVERYNKQDSEIKVANSAQYLGRVLGDF